IQMSKGVVTPGSNRLMSENQIVCKLAKATLGDRSVIDWDKYAESYDAVRDAIEKVVPGFTDYNKRVRIPGGFYLPNAPRTRKFETDDYGNKIAFTVTELTRHELAEDEYK